MWKENNNRESRNTGVIWVRWLGTTRQATQPSAGLQSSKVYGEDVEWWVAAEMSIKDLLGSGGRGGNSLYG